MKTLGTLMLPGWIYQVLLEGSNFGRLITRITVDVGLNGKRYINLYVFKTPNPLPVEPPGNKMELFINIL